MLYEHRRTSFLCFMFRIPMLHSVRLTASCEINVSGHALLFYLLFFLVVTRITLSLFIVMKLFSLVDPRLCGSRSHRSPHELALRISDRSNLIFLFLFFDDLFDLGYAALAPTGRHTSSRFDLSTI